MSTSTPSTPPPEPTYLTGDEFIEVMKGEHEDFKPKPYRLLTSAVVIDNVVVTDKIITKESDEFEHAIVILGGAFQSSFWLEGGEFLSDFLIEGGIFQSVFMIEGGTFQSDFWIQRGAFQSYFWVRGGVFQSNFVIKGGTFLSQFKIEGGYFKSYFQLFGGDFQSYFWIIGGEFQSFFLLQGGEFLSDFVIQAGSFQSDFRIQKGAFQSNFLLLGGTFQSDFLIEGGTFQSDFLVEGGAFQSNFLIEGGVIQSIIFQPRSGSTTHPFIDTLWFVNKISAVVKIKDIDLNMLILEGVLTSGATLSVSNQKLHRIRLDDFQNLGYVFFSNISFINDDKNVCKWQIKDRVIKEFKLSKEEKDQLKKVLGNEYQKNAPLYPLIYEEADDKNKPKFYKEISKFYENPFSDYDADRNILNPYRLHKEVKVADPNTQFQIINSHLGKMEFKDFPFEEFKKIEVSDSNCTEITTYGKNFSIDNVHMVDSDGKPLEDKEQEYYARYQLYNDLAIAKEKQKDTDTALYFRAISNENLRKSLSYFSEKWTSKLSLTFSKLSNNYRQSWGYPLIGVLIIGPIFYALNLMTLGLDITDFDCWSDFFIFLNPTHKFELLEDVGGQYGFLANAVDVMSRVFIGFFIYQFIQAFRKYGGR